MMFRSEDHSSSHPSSLLAMAPALHQPEPVPAIDATDQAGGSPRSKGVIHIIAGLTVAGAVFGGALAIALPQTYVATSEVMIAPAGLPAPMTADATFALVENQLRMLRSGTVLNAAVERLNLTADAEFNGSAHGSFAFVKDLIAADGADDMETRRRETFDALAQSIEARRVGNTSIVAISARTSDPAKSALIANTVSDLFIAETGGASLSSATLRDMEAQLASAERALVEFRSKNTHLASREEVATLEDKLAGASARKAALDAQVAIASGLGVDMMATGSVPAASSALEDARTRHAALKQRVDTLSTRLGPRHPDLINTQAELAGARREMENEARRASESLKQELADAARQQENLAAHVARLKGEAPGADDSLSTLRELERAADTHRIAYEDAVRAAQVGPQQGARVISQAEPPLVSSRPSAPQLSLAGALGGLLAGLGFAGWRRASERVETVDDHEAWDDALPEDERSLEAWDADHEHPLDASYQPKETDTMYPYPPFAHQAAPAPVHGQPDQNHAHHPVNPQQSAMPQAAPAGWYPPAAPHDPWALMRAYAPPVPQHAQHYPHQPVHGIVYVPVPAHHVMPQMQRPETFERDVYVDRRTDAAIEEIRQSLRALRDAIEDVAHDRYGT